uniref:Reverse transcriptase zinc-binding domain-containing protein n=1 Tax=Oryza rufipogon TaxID=4529 RepID=A0A0E0PYG8_ORYRU
MLNGVIPCKGILADKHIAVQGVEDIKHMVFTCKRAKLIWKQLSIWSRIQPILGFDRSGSVLVEEAIRKGGKVSHLNAIGIAELILTGAWYILWERRQLVHGEQIQNPARSAMSIATLTANYMLSNKKDKTKIQNGWKKPPEEMLMINVDAAFDIDSGSGGTGVY